MISQAMAIAWKDMKSEFRTKERINSMFIFSLMVILSFKFAFDIFPSDLEPLVPPILWITFFFGGMFGLVSSFAKEKDIGCLGGLMLCPVDRFAIYLGKMFSNLFLILLVDFPSLFFFAIFFVYDYHGFILPLITIVLAGTISYVIVGTLISAISVNAKTREILLPILLIPLIIFTVLMPSITATSKALGGRILEALPEIRILTMFSIIYFVLAYLLFDYVLEE